MGNRICGRKSSAVKPSESSNDDVDPTCFFFMSDFAAYAEWRRADDNGRPCILVAKATRPVPRERFAVLSLGSATSQQEQYAAIMLYLREIAPYACSISFSPNADSNWTAPFAIAKHTVGNGVFGDHCSALRFENNRSFDLTGADVLAVMSPEVEVPDGQMKVREFCQLLASQRVLYANVDASGKFLEKHSILA